MAGVMCCCLLPAACCLLPAACGFAAFDHFFGLSSAWARDIATVQAIQRRLDRFRLERWEYELGNVGPADLTSAYQHTHVTLIREFLDDLESLIAAETREWQVGFETECKIFATRREFLAQT
ncbi:SLATT domain-containing protein [Micromonospora aurantiaca]|uniref:SLATT domain-containing protein n=1 Tax=Micromonospora aurantiaca (nom. illeg.) TaxID=47850 RepID=UPI00341A2856